ncbi:MAG TPA: methyltransferase domain-containing protein [Micromonosporaceae bacterium]|jgi:SAM-dependent methyltransferase
MSVIDFYGPEGWETEGKAEELDRQRVAREQIARLVARRWGDALTIVDAGCGDGTFLDRLAKSLDRPGTSYLGLDYSAHQIAKAKLLPYEFHQCDLGVGMPLPAESVDIVHAAEVIEHLVNPDLLLTEATRVLRPGGQIVITTPNLHAWYNRLIFLAGVQPVFHETSTRSTRVGAGPLARLKADTRPVGHLRLFNRTALVDLLRLSGLEPVRILGARFHGVPRGARWIDGLARARPTLASCLVAVARKPESH